MKIAVHSVCPVENVAGLPKYQPIESLPDFWCTSTSRRPISSSAVSHEICSNSPSGRRRSGCRRRSGSLTISVNAIPFGHAKPRDSGCSLSGRNEISRSSSTVAIMPHSGSQIRQ